MKKKMITAPILPATLLERVEQLERLASDQERQLVEHKAVIDDLGRAFETQHHRITANAEYARKTLRRLGDLLAAVAEKVFPGHARAQLQISEIFRSKKDQPARK